jgi:2-keto-3-deoxy-L-rhamnonate aldolase RhmA
LTASTTTTIRMTGVSLPTPPRSRTASEAFARDFLLTLWTDDPELAHKADRAGIQRIGVDIETLGKAERQRGRGTWVSPHDLERLADVRRSLRSARLFARTNPLHAGSAAEVDRLLELGVEVLMLPMFTAADQIARFVSLVARRAAVVPLLETRAAAERISEIVRVEGIDEIHVGINDLAISIGARNRFEVLSSPVVERVAASTVAARLRFAIGAIGRVKDPALPIDPDLIYARFVALGARGALISRSFDVGSLTAEQLELEVQRSRERLAWWWTASPAARQRAHLELRDAASGCAAW